MTTHQLVLPPEYNLLTNPGFEHKNRPQASFGGSVPCLDGWNLSTNVGAITLNHIDSTIGSPGKSAQVVNTGGAGGQNAFYCRLDGMLGGGSHYTRGKLVTFAMTVKATVPGLCLVEIWYQSGAFAASAVNVGTGVERLCCTGLVPASATLVQPGLRFNTLSGTVEVNDATLVLGDQPAAYVPLDPADDLERCQRQYERHGMGWGMLAQSYQVAGTDFGLWHNFATTKGGVPTLTKAGTWQVYQNAQPRAEYPTVGGYMLRAMTNVTGQVFFYGSDFATQYVSAEWQA